MAYFPSLFCDHSFKLLNLQSLSLYPWHVGLGVHSLQLATPKDARIHKFINAFCLVFTPSLPTAWADPHHTHFHNSLAVLFSQQIYCSAASKTSLKPATSTVLPQAISSCHLITTRSSSHHSLPALPPACSLQPFFTVAVCLLPKSLKPHSVTAGSWLCSSYPLDFLILLSALL